MKGVSNEVNQAYKLNIKPGKHILPGGEEIDTAWPLEKLKPIADKYPQYFEVREKKKTTPSKNKKEAKE